jgi:hypothetical protein
LVVSTATKPLVSVSGVLWACGLEDGRKAVAIVGDLLFELDDGGGVGELDSWTEAGVAGDFTCYRAFVVVVGAVGCCGVLLVQTDLRKVVTADTCDSTVSQYSCSCLKSDPVVQFISTTWLQG